MTYDRYGRALGHRRGWYVLPCLWASLAVAPVVILAAPVCTEYVARVVTKQVRNHVSAHTLAAWAAWREKHPSWRSKSVRPAYKTITEREMGVEETSCGVVTATGMDGLKPQQPTVELPPSIFAAPLAPPTVDTTPTTNCLGIQADATSPLPVPLSPVPEPPSALLLGTGLIFAFVVATRRNDDAA